jgi:hypothetical protein
MTRRLAVVAVLVGLVFGSTAAVAHDDYRIIGTVERGDGEDTRWSSRRRTARSFQ